MIVDIYIGEFKLDTFKDETIEINSSIANVNDISKNTTEYSKSFTVPASKNNNKIFKHYYNANIDNTFDARTKIAGKIELNGIPFKTGKWRLAKVNVKQNKPYAYTINFWGNLVSLKDKFGDDLLNGLDLSDYNHTYDSANVIDGLRTSLFSGNVIYNLFAKRQLYYNSDPTDNVNTATLVNIANGGGSNTGVRWNELKPSIKIIKIIEAIENKYNVTFSRDFFGRDEFTNLFTWLNSTDGSLIAPNEHLINWTSGDATMGFNLSTDTWTNTQEFFSVYDYRITITPTDTTTPYKVIVRNFGVVVAQFESNGGNFTTPTTSPSIVNGTDTDFQYTFHISTSSTFSYSASIRIIRRVPFSGSTASNNQAALSLRPIQIDIARNLPEIKVLDFFNGLCKLFKLVVISDDNDNVYVNSLTDYYAQGKLYNLTKYVDFNSYDVERGSLLNTISFKFQEPTTILNGQFKTNNINAYGDEDLTIKDDEGKLLDGDSFTVELPFEQFVYERLIDLEDSERTNVMYGAIFDKEISPVNPKMHLFYNQNLGISEKPIAVRNLSDTKVRIDTLNIPSHTFGFDNPQYSTVFSEEFNEFDGSLISNTLYSNYYQDYISSIFNIKRRNFKFSCKNIPLRITTRLKLNDVIQIRNNYYRIDNYNFNLLTGETTFNLINSFDNTINALTANKKQIIINYQEQTQTVYVTNLNNFDYNSTELWVSCVANGNIVTFSFDANATGLDRVAFVTIINAETLQEIEIYCLQTANVVTADSTLITADSDIITADNG
jgi:hypothetical protein